MKFFLLIIIFSFVLACSSGPSLKAPDEGISVDLQMLATGGSNFEDYIHSLGIYAFTFSSEGYIFYKILAQLDQNAIQQLEDVSSRKNSKLFTATLPVGDYEFYFLGNVPEKDVSIPQPGVSRPSDIFINCLNGLPDGSYFLGVSSVRVVADNSYSPISVTLNRIVSKLVIALYGVPASIDTIGVTLGNITSRIGITGALTTDTVTARSFFPVVMAGVSDTVVYEMLTLPTAAGVSPMSLIFHSKSGEVGVRQLPDVSLLPDKYIRVTAKIVNDPVGNVNVEPGLFFNGDFPEVSKHNRLFNPEKK